MTMHYLAVHKYMNSSWFCKDTVCLRSRLVICYNCETPQIGTGMGTVGCFDFKLC